MSSAKTIKGVWDQINSALKSLQLVVESKAKEDKHLKQAHLLRIEGHSRVLDILGREKTAVLEAFKRAGGAAAVPPGGVVDTSGDPEFWAKIGELDATIAKVRDPASQRAGCWLPCTAGWWLSLRLRWLACAGLGRLVAGCTARCYSPPPPCVFDWLTSWWEVATGADCPHLPVDRAWTLLQTLGGNFRAHRRRRKSTKQSRTCTSRPPRAITTGQVRRRDLSPRRPPPLEYYRPLPGNIVLPPNITRSRFALHVSMCLCDCDCVCVRRKGCVHRHPGLLG
jgi:hypothetical protein